jgi:hypothetical protein
MIDLRDKCQPDGAADRAASAARTLAAIAHDAARKHVKRDVVAPQTHRPNVHVVSRENPGGLLAVTGIIVPALDDAERKRQARLRRWHELPHPNRKGG